MPGLTQQRVKQLLTYKPDSGEFFWKTHRSKLGKTATFNRGLGYLGLRIDGHQYSAHRVAFLYMLGAWPAQVVDHINGKRDDNRWINLRDVSHALNLQNRTGPVKARSGVRGVFWNAKAQRYAAKYMTEGKNNYLGLFDTVEQAEAALVAAKAGLPIPRHRRRYARRNEPEPAEQQGWPL